MRVDFFNFAKKSNSTKVPTGAALASFDCILKDGCSVLSPVIMLEAGLTSRPAFNYCYIPDFQRYYFISDWTFNRRLWAGSLTVDVLASFKSQIGQKQMYVLRSSAQFNGRIVDTKYPPMAKPYTYIDNLGTVYENDNGTDYAVASYFDKALSSGYYYVGFLGPNGTGVKWYVMDSYGFNKFSDTLFSFDPPDMGNDLAPGVKKQIFNPMQYIVSAYWLPTLIHGAVLNQGVTSVWIGGYQLPIEHTTDFDPVQNMNKFHADFTLRKHPQAASRGVYLNEAPYTRYTVVFPPFGTFTLDSTLMIDDAAATCEWIIDYSTGQADLTIKVTNSFMVHTSTMFGVPVRVTQRDIDVVGMTGGVIGGLMSAGAGLLSFNATAAVGGLMGAVGSVADAISPKVQSKGSSGSFIPFHSLSPKMYTDFYLAVDEYQAEMGRPLCTVTTPSALGGYIIAEKGDLEDTMALEDEIDMINSFISGGFFYE